MNIQSVSYPALLPTVGKNSVSDNKYQSEENTTVASEKSTSNPVPFNSVGTVHTLTENGATYERATVNTSISDRNSNIPPTTKTPKYASIVKNGTTLATFYNNGAMMTQNGTALPSDLVSNGTGTSLADERIAQMLKF